MPADPPSAPPSPSPEPRSPVIPLIALSDRKRTRQSIMVGVAGTILFHLLLLFGVPASFFVLKTGEASSPNRDFQIELMPDEPVVPPDDMKFVETNPSAPSNKPDDTENFSARDQQAANLEEAKKLSDDHTPQVEGTELESKKIITGDENPPEPTAPPQEEQQPTEPVEPSNPSERNPLPGIEVATGDDEAGAGSAIAERTPDPTDVPEKVEGTKNDSEQSCKHPQKAESKTKHSHRQYR